jgi:hypothetical protein
VSWRDALVLAVKGVRRRPGRAALTVLAVLLASALLTALLTISTTARTRVLDQLSSGGPLAGIKVAPAAPDPAQVNQDNPAAGAPKDLDPAALARIRALPDVRRVIPIVSNRQYVVPPRPRGGPRVQPFIETVVGVDLQHAGLLPITLEAGRLPSAGSTTEVAVTDGYVERIGEVPAHKQRVLGSVVELAAGRVEDDGGHEIVRGRWTKATVVGVVGQDAANGELLMSDRAVGQAQAWIDSGVNNSRALGGPTSPYAGAYVVAHGIDAVPKVRLEITAVGYSTSAPENLIASVRRYLRVVEIVLAAVGIIALVVAGLGIGNAMLAAVRERRREIGVLKAIGARDRDIYRVYLIEAGTLGFVGGLVGTFLGWGIADAVGLVVNRYLSQQGLEGVQLSLPVPLVVGGIAGATLLALVAGTLPALRAARLPAREAVSGG